MLETYTSHLSKQEKATVKNKKQQTSKTKNRFTIKSISDCYYSKFKDRSKLKRHRAKKLYAKNQYR